MNLPAPIEAYVLAYNAMDVDAMLAPLADYVVFQNIADGAVTAEARGKKAFEEMARLGATAFSSRRQTPTAVITVADRTAVVIDYEAAVAIDLPNGWKAGEALKFQGKSFFRIIDGKIAEIIDES